MPAAKDERSSVAAVKAVPVQAKVYGVVPPATVKFTEPVEPPLQRTFDTEVIVVVNAIGCVMTADAVVVQAFWSVIVTL